MITSKIHMFFSRFVKVSCLSFHSKEFYKDLYFNVKGVKFGYLLFILAISNLMLVFFCSFSIRDFFDVSSSSSKGSIIIDQLPVMNIQNGIIHTENPSKPVEVEYYKNRIAIIDIDAFPEKYLNSKIPLFINKTSIYISDTAGGYYKALDFNNYFSGQALLDKEFFVQSFSVIRSTLLFSAFFVFYPLGLLLRCIFISMNLALFSLFAFLYGKISGINFYFKDIFRVSIFSSFPSLFIDLFIISYLFLYNRFFFDFYYKMHSPLKENFIFLLSVGYFFFALKSIYDSGMLTSKKNTKKG